MRATAVLRLIVAALIVTAASAIVLASLSKAAAAVVVMVGLGVAGGLAAFAVGKLEAVMNLRTRPTPVTGRTVPTQEQKYRSLNHP